MKRSIYQFYSPSFLVHRIIIRFVKSKVSLYYILFLSCNVSFAADCIYVICMTVIERHQNRVKNGKTRPWKNLKDGCTAWGLRLVWKVAVKLTKWWNLGPLMTIFMNRRKWWGVKKEKMTEFFFRKVYGLKNLRKQGLTWKQIYVGK